MSTRTKAMLAMLLAQLLWSTVGLSKIIVRIFDPFFAGFVRFFVASIVILPFFLKEGSRPKHVIRDVLPFSLAGAANLVFYYVGLQTSTANAASLIYAGIPLATAVMAHLIIRERLTPRRLIGIIVGLVGVVLIALLPALEQGAAVSGNLLGNIFFVCATLSWSIYLIFSRHAAEKGYSPVVISSMFIFTTCIVFFLVSLFTFQPSYVTTLMKPSIALLVVYLGVLATVVTFTLYQWVVKHTSATTTSLSAYVSPIFSVTVNTIVLKETITPLFLLGAAIVLTGILITSGKTLFNEVWSWRRR